MVARGPVATPVADGKYRSSSRPAKMMGTMNDRGGQHQQDAPEAARTERTQPVPAPTTTGRQPVPPQPEADVGLDAAVRLEPAEGIEREARLGDVLGRRHQHLEAQLREEAGAAAITHRADEQAHGRQHLTLLPARGMSEKRAPPPTRHRRAAAPPLSGTRPSPAAAPGRPKREAIDAPDDCAGRLALTRRLVHRRRGRARRLAARPFGCGRRPVARRAPRAPERRRPPRRGARSASAHRPPRSWRRRAPRPPPTRSRAPGGSPRGRRLRGRRPAVPRRGRLRPHPAWGAGVHRFRRPSWRGPRGAGRPSRVAWPGASHPPGQSGGPARSPSGGRRKTRVRRLRREAAQSDAQ